MAPSGPTSAIAAILASLGGWHIWTQQDAPWIHHVPEPTMRDRMQSLRSELETLTLSEEKAKFQGFQTAVTSAVSTAMAADAAPYDKIVSVATEVKESWPWSLEMTCATWAVIEVFFVFFLWRTCCRSKSAPETIQAAAPAPAPAAAAAAKKDRAGAAAASGAAAIKKEGDSAKVDAKEDDAVDKVPSQAGA